MEPLSIPFQSLTLGLPNTRSLRRQRKSREQPTCKIIFSSTFGARLAGTFSAHPRMLEQVREADNLRELPRPARGMSALFSEETGLFLPGIPSLNICFSPRSPVVGKLIGRLGWFWEASLKSAKQNFV